MLFLQLFTRFNVNHTSLRRLDSNGNLKVSDFGLGEDVYTTGYFRQNRDAPVKLPYKWMSLESLEDGIFTEKSDVVCCRGCKICNARI